MCPRKGRPSLSLLPCLVRLLSYWLGEDASLYAEVCHRDSMSEANTQVYFDLKKYADQ